MNAQNWNDSLTLLGLIIMDEPLSRHEKIERFKNAAVNFKQRVSPNFTLTEDNAEDWFIQNEPHLRKNMSSIYYESHLKSVLNNLNALPDKSAFLFSLLKVSLSDQHNADVTNPNVYRFIEKAEDCWGLPTTQSSKR